MLKLRRIEVNGFGPFAEPQVIDLPDEPGVTVIYGENMRGKTSLLNAIRYAFFGTVVGRGSRERLLHTVTNRDLVAEGRYGFSVSLGFSHDGSNYELLRRCKSRVPVPTSDANYEHEVFLRKGNAVQGPQERDRTLLQAFPKAISRFFLFDGELLQEYEELLHNDNAAGRKISEAIERILGVPILKRGKLHLTTLSEQADRDAAQAASRHKETEAFGTALQLATAQKQAHQDEHSRKIGELKDLNDDKAALERHLQSMKKYTAILEERDQAARQLEEAGTDERAAKEDLQRLMADAWRSLVAGRMQQARVAAEKDAQHQLDGLSSALRRKALESGSCDICLQDVPTSMREHLHAALGKMDGSKTLLSNALSRLTDLSRFNAKDVSGEVTRLARSISNLQLKAASLSDKVKDLNALLSESDPDNLRRSRSSYSEVIERIVAVKSAIDAEAKKIEEQDVAIQRLNKLLAVSRRHDLQAAQARSTTLRAAAEVFGAAVERYKSDLRSRVEKSATKLFLAMTTEETDYAGLTINENYGLTIRHRDGRAEDARSAGAEHVVALALMGALQQNAPLRGPIVMDSPFGRLDERHTAKVVQTLPTMAEQVVLLVYESEVGRARMRELLGSSLRKEYELEYVSARRTNVRAIL